MTQVFGAQEIFFLLSSLRWTLVLTALALAIGAAFGLLIAIARVSQHRPIRVVAATYVKLIQGVPVLMLLFLSYYGLSLAGLNLPPLVAAALSLSIYAAAYLGEIWRGSIQSVPKPQWEASASLALSRFEQYRYVVLPQAIRISIPSTVGFIVQLVKNTSIVSVVGFIDLARAGQLINNSIFQPFLVFGVVALFYFSICFPLSRLSKHLEKKFHVYRAA